MIRKDFENGGFPISKTRPVLCFYADGTFGVAHDRFGLKTLISQNFSFSLRVCIGVWPGKFNTDCFPLDPTKYQDAPPEEYRTIDSANQITAHYTVNQEFKKIVYSYMNDSGTKVNVESKNTDLLRYVNEVGLQKQSIFED